MNFVQRQGRLKDYALINSDNLPVNTDADYMIRYIEISNVDSSGIISRGAIESLRFEDAPSRARRRVHAGDTIISSVRPNLQAAAYFSEAENNLVCSTGFNVVASRFDYISGRFLHYVLVSDGSLQYLVATAKGVGYPAVDEKDFNTLRIAAPNRQEQDAIVEYLNQACASIGHAIAAKQRQLETLLQLRKSIIHKAVTKGLDDSVATRDSGIAWVGHAPATWKKDKIYRLCEEIGSGGTPTSTNPDYYDGDIPWVQTGDLNDGEVTVTEKTITQRGLAESSAKIFPQGTLLVAMYGSIGKLGIMGFAGATNQACCALRPAAKIRADYLLYLFQVMRGHLVSQSYGGVQSNISQEVIKQQYIVYPGLEGQAEVVDFLRGELAKLSGLEGILRRQIATLREYRKSLIHECVTGKRRLTGKRP